MKFQLPTLKYKYNEFEPYIDAKTMEIHYNKHHGTYTLNLNNAIKGTNLEHSSIEEILIKGSHIPVIRNNGGGFYNHNLFWDILLPNNKNNNNKIKGKILDLINISFQNFENFKKQFIQVAINHFGSGWAWLCQENEKLTICSTRNQDNPLMADTECIGTPILGLDLWEHAYYLKYQNRRIDYIESFFKIINWESVNLKLK